MIKVATGDIPKVPGLKEAIIKKWGSEHGRMTEVPQMYVRDVPNNSPTDISIGKNSIAQSDGRSQARVSSANAKEVEFKAAARAA